MLELCYYVKVFMYLVNFALTLFLFCTYFLYEYNKSFSLVAI